MSNTRHADGNGPLRQERFASSQEFKRGLMANLVAKRCSVLERTEDRSLIWFLQLLSHKTGGLEKFADEILKRFPERVATASMRRFGCKPGQVYSAKQVKAVRAEIVRSDDSQFLTRGEETPWEQLGIESDYKSELRPISYPASDFLKVCNQAASGLGDYLTRACLDPAASLAEGNPWYLPTLFGTLREIQTEWIESHKPAAVTSIGKQVCSALEYASQTRRLVLVDGMARIGKSFAAKSWCDSQPGRARYVQCPSSNDDFSFFRVIAEALGVSINLKSKAQELRNRIEETLQAGDLMLVIDEAHYLWPQSHFRNTTPGRVNWLMTALVNMSVPVALVTTPQFFRSQQAIEAVTCWTSEQFIGRIGHYEKLPDSLTDADLKAVAAAVLPSVDTRCIEALALYAKSSAKYLAGIESAAARAKFIAQRESRERVEFRDIKRAIQESVIPSDSAFAAAMKAVEKPSRKRAVSVPARPLQNRLTSAETILPGALRDTRPISEAVALTQTRPHESAIAS